jgi:PAS domain-containing protein
MKLRKKAEGELSQVAQDLRLVIVTDRKKAETTGMASETRIFIDAPANVSTFGMDMEGRVNEWNTAAEKLLGYSSDEAMACLLLDSSSQNGKCALRG